MATKKILAMRAEAALAAYLAEHESSLWENETHTLQGALRILREHAGGR